MEILCYRLYSAIHSITSYITEPPELWICDFKNTSGKKVLIYNFRIYIHCIQLKVVIADILFSLIYYTSVSFSIHTAVCMLNARLGEFSLKTLSHAKKKNIGCNGIPFVIY